MMYDTTVKFYRPVPFHDMHKHAASGLNLYLGSHVAPLRKRLLERGNSFEVLQRMGTLAVTVAIAGSTYL